MLVTTRTRTADEPIPEEKVPDPDLQGFLRFDFDRVRVILTAWEVG
jgi:hypothetical protein